MKWENVYKSLTLSLLLLLLGCTSQPKEIADTAQEKNIKETQTTPVEIELLIQEQRIAITLEENKTTQSLLQSLPIEAKISDFANAEKIIYLDTTLEESTTKGYNPQIYDFAYYAPWHNLVLFYKDQPYDDGLILLGNIANGQNTIQNIPNDTLIKLQKKK